MNLLLNIIIICISVIVILIFARKGANSYNQVLLQISWENELCTEIILGLESAGRNVCNPLSLKREIRTAIWELYNNLRVQPGNENKTIVFQRKMLEKKQVLYQNLEQGKVNLEILPFLGIIGTLSGFAVPYLLNVAKSTKFTFNVTGLGFFLAASSTICALLALIYLKKKYEAIILAEFDYFESQEKALEKIMVDYGGFRILEEWLTGTQETLSQEEKKEENEKIKNKNSEENSDSCQVSEINKEFSDSLEALDKEEVNASTEVRFPLEPPKMNIKPSVIVEASSNNNNRVQTVRLARKITTKDSITRRINDVKHHKNTKHTYSRRPGKRIRKKT